MGPVKVYAYMRRHHNENRLNTVDDKGYLSALSNALERLTSQQMLSQQEIEAATGVDQTTISRAKNGKLQRVTNKIRRLRRYADMRQMRVKISTEVARTAETFLAAGGTEEELLGSIRHATSLVLRHPKD